MAALGEIDLNSMDMDEKIKKPKNTKRLSVERIYQKKTQLEHILLRPDSYIGSTEPTTQAMWVWDVVNKVVIQKNITYTPGLYKIFDEVIVNAADNKQRDKRMDTIKINIDMEKNSISVWNNGKGIPIEMHKTEKLYVPSMIFGQLLTSSNYDDSEKKVVGGRNGYGAKLCNIFSTKFTVETATNGKKFKQTWKNNMGKAETEKVSDFSGTDFTCITFSPDLPKFKMDKMDNDTVSLLMRRAYDMAGVVRGVKVFLNGERIKVKTFKEYVDLYVKGSFLNKKSDIEAQLPKIIHEQVNPRWEVAITVSESGFQQSSFVNSIATTKGGTHTDYIVSQVCDKLLTTVKKKTGKGGFNVKPFQIKSHLWVFINCLIENPTFDSQTKENMTLRNKAFGSTCELTDKYIKQVQECGVLDNIMSWVKYKSEAQLNKKCSGTKHTRLKGIAKLDDANDAGTKHSRDCTLIVTEGDSAKALAMAGLSIVGRNKYGVFPLRGKMLNVRDAGHKQIMENAEIGNLLKIIGLQFGKKYESEADLKSLRYGHLMIMADQDQDGSHIKGLIINFIHASWPSLLKLDFLEEFITPIVKVTKGNQIFSFFSLPEFEEWKSETSNYKAWRIKYYKGLGSSTSKEGKEYFANMQRHRVVFEYDGPSSDQAIVMAFSKKMANERKNWLQIGMNERKMRREAGLPEIFLYQKDTKSVTYREFVNKELILFSNGDNERSIPSMVDGVKPGQRKVLFTCMKRNDKNEVKVAQLAGSIAELSAYHHGEISLMSTIINMAQNFVGSNNLNLLQPIGQFGTRHMAGKDSASPRYIHTMLSTITRMVFPTQDDPLLNFLFEDNQRIEPEWYCPIIPMVLINGAEGIGTGYSTKVPNFDVREVTENVRRLINGEEPIDMIPAYKNFNGEVIQSDNQKYIVRGSITVIDETTLEITELPIGRSTVSYKESVMDVMLYGNEKCQPFITDYREHHTDTTVKFEVSLPAENLIKAEQEGLYKKFNLENTISITNMVLFDQFGCLKKYNTVKDILTEFYELRMTKYRERKSYIEGMLEAEAAKLENQARFILEKIDKKIIIENRSKRDVISTLVERGYLSDPVKSWKASQDRSTFHDDESQGAATEIASTASANLGGPDFSYILNMSIMSLSKEKKEELLKQRDEKREELDTIRRMTPSELWVADLDTFLEELNNIEELEKQEELISNKNTKRAQQRAGVVKNKLKKPKVKDVKKAFESKEEEAKQQVVKKVEDQLEGDDISSQGSKEEDDNNERKLLHHEPEPLSLAERLKKNLGQTSVAPKKSTLKAFNGNESDIETEQLIETSSKQRTKEETRKKVDAQDDITDDSWNDTSMDDDSDEDFDINDRKPKQKLPKRKFVKSITSSTAASLSEDNQEVAATRALIERLSPMKKDTKSNSVLKKKVEKGKQQTKLNFASINTSKKVMSPESAIEKDTTTVSKPTLKRGRPKKVDKTNPGDSTYPKTGNKRVATLLDDDSENSHTDPLTTDNKKQSVRPGKKLKAKETDDSCSSLDDKAKACATKPEVKKRKVTKKRKMFDSDEDDDSFHIDMDESDVAPVVSRPRLGRGAATQKKKYSFSSDESDDEDDI